MVADSPEIHRARELLKSSGEALERCRDRERPGVTLSARGAHVSAPSGQAVGDTWVGPLPSVPYEPMPGFSPDAQRHMEQRAAEEAQRKESVEAENRRLKRELARKDAELTIARREQSGLAANYRTTTMRGPGPKPQRKARRK